MLARVSAMVSVAPARLERVKGSTEPITVYRLLEVKSLPADPAA